MTPQSLLSLRKFLVPEIVYGEGALALVGRYAMNLGAKNVLIVTDPGIQAAGWASKVEQCLQASDITYVTYSDVSPNPKDYEVMAGLAVYQAQGCDLIVAIGGGSPMDCAKGIGVVAGNDGNILDFEGVDEVPKPGPPFIFIPTTAGSAADVSQFAIVNDTTRKVKIAIISKMVIPDIALIDPETSVSMSPALTAATGMDVLCHAIEAFVSTASSPLTDMNALTAIELVVNNLQGAYQYPENMVYRKNMMMASLMAGLAFSNASLGLVHAMAHSLGGLLGLAHGECNALLLEQVVLYNYTAATDRYDRIAKALNIQVDDCEPSQRATAIADRLASFRERLAITQRLRDMGVCRSDIAQLARFASDDPCLATNPRAADISDIEKIYKQIY